MLEQLSQFHFLRPLWLSGLLFIPLFWVLFKAKRLYQNDWHKVIDASFLTHLTPASSGETTNQSGHYLLSLILALSVLALAGPSWQKKPAPVIQVQDNLVVILDLSLSMLATDVNPDRLTRAKQKLEDLLKLRKEGNTALIVFSGDAHVVTPLTDDVQTILANMDAIDPFIMPVIGSRPDKAVSHALNLFEQANAKKARIIMLTDGIEAKQADDIVAMLSDSALSPPLSILAVGTAQGGPISIPKQGYLKDQGQVILPKLDINSLKALTARTQGNALEMSLDDTDLERLNIAPQTGTQTHFSTEQDIQQRKYDTWEDQGIFLLFILLPLALLAYRKNMLIVLALCFSFTSEPSYALSWEDLWKTKDQQAQALMDQGLYEDAAALYESPTHKAYANYQAGNYDATVTLTEAKQDLINLYNQANALAKQHKLEEALEKYNEVLNKAPNHEDARHNKALVEKILEQQKQEQQNQDQQNQDQQNQDQQNQDQQNQDQQNQDQQNQDQQNQDQQNQDQQNQDQQNQDQQNQEQQNQDQQNQDQQNQDQQNQEDQEKNDPSDDMTPSAMEQKEPLTDEEKQSYEQWMRRVPDDPGALLRRKFEQQAQERARSQQNIRREGDPIW